MIPFLIFLLTLVPNTHVYEDGSVAFRPHGPTDMRDQITWCIPTRICYLQD